MHTMKNQDQEIRKEGTEIGKCASLICSRLALLLCLLFLLLPMRPTSVYLFALIAIFPWVFTNILEGKKSNSKKIALPFCAKKYSYTPARYLAEKCSGIGIIICLVAWQVSASRSSGLEGIWKTVPALCLLAYCLCRLIGAIIFRRKIHQDYFDLKLLDD